MRILIVGTHESNIAKASVLTADQGADVRCEERFGQALKNLCDGHSADLLLLDAHANIRDAVDRLREARIYLPIIAYGQNCSAGDAAAAIRAGARDFLPLPPEPELIAAVLASITEPQREFVFRDARMIETVQLAEQFAPADATVMITGESGTGKEVIARFLHRNSRRSTKPFISVNCAAIPDNLLESELFGHEKGAFTGATQRRIGKFEEADGGTLLLDEISEMDIRLQAKLLRAVQEREIDRVGGTKPVTIDIRLLATSNRDLDKAVQNGEFRADLLFRLNVLHLEIPPLRLRKDDILPLCMMFMGKYQHANQLPERQLSTSALAAMQDYAWPGNVRELENCIHRAVLLAAKGEIYPEHLRLPRDQTESEPLSSTLGNELIGRTVAEVERDLILGTLASTLGNRTRAAEILGISIRTLRNKLQLYGPSASGINA